MSEHIQDAASSRRASNLLLYQNQSELVIEPTMDRGSMRVQPLDTASRDSFRPLG